MPEPITLALLGATALTEGVKFLYKQADEALQRYYENKKAAQQAATISSGGQIPDVLQGGSQALTIHTEALEKAIPQLEPLVNELSSYGKGYKDVVPADADTLKKMDTLRRLLEAVYKQPLTFRGENRPESDINVDGHVKVHDLYGDAVGLEADSISEGNATGTGEADTVHKGGSLTGVKVKHIGGG